MKKLPYAKIFVAVFVAVVAVLGVNTVLNHRTEETAKTEQGASPVIDAEAFQTPEPHKLVYKPDGSKKEILKSQTNDYLNDGWYNVPVTEVFHTSGETKVIPKKELRAYTADGWYDAPVMTVYNTKDASSVIYQTEYDAYHEKGWFKAPVTTVYNTEDRSMIIYKTELEGYLNDGWYKSKEEVPKPVPSADVTLAPVPKPKPDVPPGTKLVALTFDDGPGKYTDAILDCLVANNAKATFFVVGTGAKANPATLKRTYDLGMEIGNHTMNHANLKKLDEAGVIKQFNDASRYIVAATGAEPTLIRPPYGNYNATVKAVAPQPLILWSIDTLDWKTKNADSTVNTILNEVKDGSIVLMHDIHAPTLEAVKRVVPELIARGYKLVTVSELAAAKGVALAPGKNYSSIK